MDADFMQSLLKDPAALENAMQAVSSLLGGNEMPPPSSEPDESFSSAGTEEIPDAASAWMQRALPAFGAILQSGREAVPHQKRALLSALKPFVASDMAGQFDHAVRLVSMARMARTALGQLSARVASPDTGKEPTTFV